jgi:hypothetical protein
MSETKFNDVTKADIEIFLECINKKSGIVCDGVRYHPIIPIGYRIINTSSIIKITVSDNNVLITHKNSHYPYEYPMESFRKDIEDYKKSIQTTASNFDRSYLLADYVDKLYEEIKQLRAKLTS